ncbi:MAG: phosphotransferase enzyme family protein [Ilumatobacter sp.]
MSALPSADELIAALANLVGPIDVVEDLSWTHGESLVIDARSGTHGPMIVKSHRQHAKFLGELHAYRRWAPALGHHAPRLIAVDESLRVLVLTKVAGAIGSISDETSREAGRLLAMFHGADEPVRVDGYAASQRDRLERWCRRAAPGVITRRQISFVSGRLEELTELDDPVGVPCHRDYHPRNWLTAASGHLTIIDFEHSRYDPWIEDIVRLWTDDWVARPRAAEHFLDGYGSSLDDDDRRRLQARASLSLLTTIVWATEHDDVAFASHARTQLERAMAGTPGPI